MLYALLLIINLVTFILYGIDKRKAVRHRRRISEASLLAFTFLGGTIGAIAAMLTFRHKVSKKPFLVKLGAAVLVQMVIIYVLTAAR